MKLNKIEHNPIEMIRINLKMTQKDFALKLGYQNKDQYAYHANRFTIEIIEKIKNHYNIDITKDVISYLLNKIKCLKSSKSKPAKKEVKGQTAEFDFLDTIQQEM